MQKWKAYLKYSFENGPPVLGVEDKAKLLHNLEGRCAVLTMSDRSLALAFELRAQDFETAMSAAKIAADDAFAAIGLPPERIIRGEIIDAAEAQHEDDVTPDYMGVAEIAQALGVSKQRVVQMSKTRNFPAPAQRLAAGPIWRGETIDQVKHTRLMRLG
jgi:hypothetical protein